ncbi:MAG: PD-(D/E)XK nuclease family protein, partial [Lachnospiraceae bacterium]|nr:PD-(D/E)XK nuclease family protein [Lachnospiraceae bacterium]
MLRSGLSGLSAEETDLLDNYVREHGVRGFSSWARTWEYGQDAAACEPLREAFCEAIRPFKEQMSEARTAKERTLALYQLLEDRGVYEKMMEMAGRWAGEADEPLCARSGAQIYAAVLKIFDQISELMGEEEISAEDYAKILEEGLASLQVGLIPGSNNRVMVGDMKRTRLGEIKALLVLGTNDGVTPAVSVPGGILTDREKEVLAGCGVELSPTIREETCQDVFYLYLNLTKPMQVLHLFLSQTDSSGKALNPSAVIAKIRLIFPGLKTEEDAARAKEVSYRLRGDDGLGFLAEEMKKPEEARDSLTPELVRYYLRHGREDELDRLLEGVFYSGAAEPLAPADAELLYGTHLHGSVTGLTQYAACPFKYFANFGLRLEEREEYEVRALDLGNVLHDAAERFGQACRREGLSWGELSDEKRDALARAALSEAVENYGEGLFHKDSRSEHLAARLENSFLRTMKVLCRQVAQGEFEPAAFEAGFDRIPELSYDLGEGRRLTLRGQIDRIDTARVGEKLYVKVIDYKTGSEKYDWARMYAGLQMQLPVYLKGALAHEARMENEETRPAGFLYYQMQDPFVKNKTEEQAEDAYLRELRPNGLLNETPGVLTALDRELGVGEELAESVSSAVVPVTTTKSRTLAQKGTEVVSEIGLSHILRRTDENLTRFGKEILQGSNAAMPYQYSLSADDNACSHCAYRA